MNRVSSLVALSAVALLFVATQSQEVEAGGWHSYRSGLYSTYYGGYNTFGYTPYYHYGSLYAPGYGYGYGYGLGYGYGYGGWGYRSFYRSRAYTTPYYAAYGGYGYLPSYSYASYYGTGYPYTTYSLDYAPYRYTGYSTIQVAPVTYAAMYGAYGYSHVGCGCY